MSSSNRRYVTTSIALEAGTCTCKMEPSSPKETERRVSLDTAYIEQSILSVGATAQLRRRNSSTSRGRSRRKTLQRMSETNRLTEEWSETFVAQDGVLTTNFCSTEL